MEEKEKKVVEMTEQERKEFEEYKAFKQKKELQEKTQKERECYKAMVSDMVEEKFEEVAKVSEQMKEMKKDVYDSFAAIKNIKKELYNTKEGQNWHTFINKDMTKRITLGRNITVQYDDTVNAGIEKVKEYVTSLAGDDEKTQMLVKTVLRLLSKDGKGNLKPEKVLELERLADEYKSEEFSLGVKIIRDAYKPQYSKEFLKAEYKNEQGEWVSVPMNIVDC